MVRTRTSAKTDEWVITFADLMTLLFIFFVLLTMMSTQPKNCKGIHKYMEENRNLFLNYELHSTKLSCIISLPQDFLFRSGDAEIKRSAFDALAPFFKKIREFPEHRYDLVIVEGHTDNVPIHTKKFPSNWELSSARSTNIATFLINEMNYAADLVSVNAFADTRPKVKYIDDNGQPLTGEALRTARQKNRRVEIILTTPPKSIEETNFLFDGRE